MSRPPAGSPRDQVIEACLANPGSAEDYPFGDEVAVFKVAGKMFALVPLAESHASVSLKCNPGLAAGLRQKYPAGRPGTTSAGVPGLGEDPGVGDWRDLQLWAERVQVEGKQP